MFGIGHVVQLRDRWIGLGSDVPTANAETNGSTAPLVMTSWPVQLPKCNNDSQHLHLTVNAEVSIPANTEVALGVFV